MTLANEKHGSLYIMRHGKTDWNEQHKIQGRTDIPLNDEGRKMAAEAAEEYKVIHFDICFCTRLKLAKEPHRYFFPPEIFRLYMMTELWKCVLEHMKE